MSLDALSPANQDYFREMELAPERSRELVRDCILNYTMPDECCGIITWIIFRVVNAVKAIFGISDWQMAVETVKNNTILRAYHKNIIAAEPPDDAQKAIKAQLVEHFKGHAERFLNTCLCLQEEPTPRSAEMRALFVKINTENYLTEIEGAIKNHNNNIHPRNGRQA